MAQTPQKKIDQIEKQFEQLNNLQKINSPTPAQTELVKQFYQRQQPLYGQGNISGETSAEKRKSRWRRAGDAAKGALSSIYGAAAFIPEVIGQIGAAGIDQLAGTNTADKVDNFFGYIPNKLRDSASSTYHFDKGQEYTDAALTAAALLGAGRIGGTSSTAKSSGVRQPLTNEMMNLERINKALKNSNIPVYVETTNNPKGVSKGFTRTEIGNRYQGFNVKDMPAYAQKKVANMYNEAHPEGPRMANFAGITKEGELPNEGIFAKYIPDRWQELADINKASRELGVGKDTLKYAQEYLNNARGGNRSIKETADYLKNTSRARAKKLKNSNRSKAERTLLKKAERDALQAEEDARNKTLEEMYNEWKRREDEIREAAEDAYNGKLRDEGRRYE